LNESPLDEGRLIVFRKNQIVYLTTQLVSKQPTHEGRLIVFRKNQIVYLTPQLVSKQPTHEEHVQNEFTLTLQNAKEVRLRRSFRIMRSTIPSDYFVYLHESDFDVESKDDPKLFSQAMNGEE
jgi:hypothetical protein